MPITNLQYLYATSFKPQNLTVPHGTCSNVVNDTFDPFGGNTETMFIIYAVCHMTGMSSACANPLLYGWLNDNIRKEFCEIWASASGKFRKLLLRVKRPDDGKPNNHQQVSNSVVTVLPPSVGNQTKFNVSTHIITITEIPEQRPFSNSDLKAVWNWRETVMLNWLWFPLLIMSCIVFWSYCSQFIVLSCVAWHV